MNHRCFLLLLTACLSAGLSAFADALDVTPQPRKVVSYGPDDLWIRETAVTSDRSTPGQVKLVASWITQDETTLKDRLAYAISRDSGTTWSDKDNQANWRILPMPSGYNYATYYQFDPGVVFDPITGAFVLAGCNRSIDTERPWRVVTGTMPSGMDTIASAVSLPHFDFQNTVSSDFLILLWTPGRVTR